MSVHKQVEITRPIDGKKISVDSGMEKIITLLWSKNIVTGMSCQAIKPRWSTIPLCWISFVSPRQLKNIRALLELYAPRYIIVSRMWSCDLWFDARRLENVYKILKDNL